MGQNGPGQVVLGRQGGEHLLLPLLHGGGKQLRLPARQIPLLHVEHGVAALPRPPVQAPDVRVGAEPGDDRLLFREGADGVDPVPEGCRLLEPQGLRLRLHLPGHLPEELLGLALQHLTGLPDAAVVLCLRHLRAAEAVAPAHVEVQAGPLRPDVPGKFPAAGGEAQGGAHGVQGLPGLEPPAEGAEVLRPVVGPLVDHGKPGIGPPGEADEGIALVVLEQDIIAGHVPLDEGVLQHQGLELAGDEDGIKVVDLGDHLPRLSGVGGAVLKVLADPVFQPLRLAHIDDLPGFVHHQIDPRQKRQVIGLLFQLVLGHGPPPFKVGCTPVEGLAILVGPGPLARPIPGGFPLFRQDTPAAWPGPFSFQVRPNKKRPPRADGQHGEGSLLSEVVFHQVHQRGDRLFLIAAIGDQGDGGALHDAQGQHA